MGTLRRAREDDKASGQSAVQQRKLLKVDEKIRSDREKLIQSQKASLAVRLSSESTRRDQLLVERNALHSQLGALATLHHKASLATFLRTEAEPPLYYKPNSHNTATTAKLKARQSEILPPLSAELEQLEVLPDPTPPSAEERVLQGAPAESGGGMGGGGMGGGTGGDGTGAEAMDAAVNTSGGMEADSTPAEPEEPPIAMDGIGEEEPLAFMT